MADPSDSLSGATLEKELQRLIRKANGYWISGESDKFSKERIHALEHFKRLTDEQKDKFDPQLSEWLLTGSEEPFSKVSHPRLADRLSFDGTIDGEFNELAKRVHASWEKLDFEEKRFHEVATTELSNARLHEKIDPLAPARWAIHNLAIPDQVDPGQRFGEPPITIFRGDRFDIDVYYWLDGTTCIHEHGFCGSFGVLAGSSLHSHYDFKAEKVFNRGLALGKATLRQCEMLEPGDCHPIEAGEDLVHALFHLDRPSVSVVIRTAAKWALPQRHFLPPSIAVTSFTSRDEQRRLHSLRMLARIESPTFFEDLQVILNTCPPDEFVNLLVSLRDFLGHSDNLPVTFYRTIPERVELLREVSACLKEFKRSAKLIELRASTHDAEERFLLALLLNLPTRELLNDFIVRRWPGSSSAETMERLFTTMFARGDKPPFDLPSHEQTATIFSKLLAGSSPSDFPGDVRPMAENISKNSILRPFMG